MAVRGLVPGRRPGTLSGRLGVVHDRRGAFIPPKTRTQHRASRAPSALLETFSNSHPGRDYLITHTCPEFTALCPKTGQPDFATLHISYVPDRLCVELKSLKLYLVAFRDRGIYYEQVTNMILDDLVRAVRPRRMTVEGHFNVRGGISSVVQASFEATGARGGLGAKPQ